MIPKSGRQTEKIGKMVCTKPGEDISKEAGFKVNAQLQQFIGVGGGIEIASKAAIKAKASGRAEEIDIWTYKLCEMAANGVIAKRHYREFVRRILLGPSAGGGGGPAGASEPLVGPEDAKMLFGTRPPSDDDLVDPELGSLFADLPALRNAVKKKDYDLARAALEARRKQDADNPDVLFGLAEVLFRKAQAQGKTNPSRAFKNHRDAERLFRRVKTLQPDRAMAYTRLGEVLEATDRLEDALKVYTEAHKYFGDAEKENKEDPIVLFGLAEAQYGLRQWVSASQTYKRVTEKDPNHARAFLRLGWIIFDLGRKKQAHKYYQKGIAIQKKRSGKPKGTSK